MCKIVVISDKARCMTRSEQHTLVVGEVVLHRTDGQLLLEAVDFVKEEDDGRLDEPARIADGVEEGQGLLHAIDRLVLEQQLVVF